MGYATFREIERLNKQRALDTQRAMPSERIAVQPTQERQGGFKSTVAQLGVTTTGSLAMMGRATESKGRAITSGKLKPSLTQRVAMPFGLAKKANEFAGQFRWIKKGREVVGTAMEKLGGSFAEMEDKASKYWQERVNPEYATMRDKEGKIDPRKLISPVHIAHQIATGFGSMTPAIATGNPIAGMVVMGAIEKGDAVETYKQELAKRKGVKVEELTKEDLADIDEKSDYYGIVSGAMEMLVPMKILKRIGGKKVATSFVKKLFWKAPTAYVRNGVQEGGTEWLQRFTQNAIGEFSGFREEGKLTEGAIDEFIAGFYTGGLMGMGEMAGEQPTSVPKKTALPEEPEEEIVSPELSAPEQFKQLVKALPQEAKAELAQAVTNPMTTEGIARLSSEERALIGIGLNTAKQLPNIDLKTIESNVRLLEQAGTKIPEMKPVKIAEMKKLAGEPVLPIEKKAPTEKPIKVPEKKITKKPVVQYKEMTKKEREALEEVGEKPYINVLEDQVTSKQAVKTFRRFFTEEEMPTKIVERIITPDGGRAWGATMQKMVEFVENPREITPYHEAVHTYIKLYLSQKRYNELTKAVGEKLGIEIAESKREEYLADDFINFIKEGKTKSKSPAIIRAFRWLKKQLKTLIGKKDKIASFYEDILKRKRPGKIQVLLGKRGVGKETKYQAEELLTTDKGALKVQAVWNKALKSLYGTEAVSITDILKVPSDREITSKGLRTSFAEGKRIVRTKVQEAKIKERGKSAEKMKELRTSLQKAYKEKIGTADEIKKQAIEYIKAALPIGLQGKYLTMIRKAKTIKNLGKVLASVDKRRNVYERKLLVASITKSTKNINKLPVDIQRTVIKITSQIELKKHTKKLLDRLKSTQEYLDKQANDYEMPRRVLNELGILKRTPFDELSTEQLIKINNQLQQYNTVGLRVMKERAVRKTQTMKEELADLEKGSVNLDVIDPSRKLNPFDSKQINISEKTRDRLSRLQINLIGIDRLCNKADGRVDYAGPNFRIFKKPVDFFWNEWQTNEDKVKQTFYKMLSDLKMTDKNSTRIAIYAYNNQRGGREKLLKDHGMTTKQIDSVVLDNNEMAVYNWMRMNLDQLHEALTAKMKKENNAILGKVVNYFPMMTDYSVAKPLFEEMVGEGRLNSVPFGNIKERREYAHQELQMDAFHVFDAYVGKSTYFMTMDATITRLTKLAKSERYRKAVGDNMQRAMLTWLNVLARKGGAVKYEAKWQKELNKYNNRLSITILGLRITTVAKQPLALLDGAAEIGAYAFEGVYHVIKPSWRVFINENSSEMRNRTGGDQAFMELAQDKPITRIQDVAMLPIKFTDQYTAGAIWCGAYTKYMNELGIKVDFKKPNKEAIRYANHIVRKTQSTGNFKDIPLAMVNEYRVASKLIFKFQNFVLNRWSYLSEDLPDHMKNNKKLAVQQMSFVAMSMAMEAGISSLYFSMMWGRDDDEESRTARYIKSILSSTIQTVPILGQILSSINYGTTPVPLIDAGNKFFKSLKETALPPKLKKPTEAKKQRRAKIRAKHLVRTMSISLGTIFGMPTEQARALLERWLFPPVSKAKKKVKS